MLQSWTAGAGALSAGESAAAFLDPHRPLLLSGTPTMSLKTFSKCSPRHVFKETGSQHCIYPAKAAVIVVLNALPLGNDSCI